MSDKSEKPLTPLEVKAITPPEPKPELTQEEIEELQRQKTAKLKGLLQTFGIVPNDTNIQMFQQLFDVKTPLQLTVLPQKHDVTHVLCLGAVAELVKPFFPDESEIKSLPAFLYEKTILGMRSYKGTFVSMFQRIFEQNPPADMLLPNTLSNVIPQDPKRSFRDKLTGANKE